MVQLPAMNTPQFSWCRTRLPRHPQPVPPIFQPEVAARAIVWASSHRRREIYVGWPTVKAIYGQESRRAMPTDILQSLHTAVRRRTSRYRRTGRTTCSNPPADQFAAHGIFDDRAHTFSPMTWIDLHRAYSSAQRGGSCRRRIRHDARTQDDEERSGARREAAREGRFQRWLSLIAGVSAVLSGIEVAYEHYRGSYSRRVMYTPVILSGAMAVAGIAGFASKTAAKGVLRYTSILTLADGIIGFYFHTRGIERKPGGWRLPLTNIVMGPPICGPLLFGVAAYLGLIASFLRRDEEAE